IYVTDNIAGESYLSEVRYGGHHIKSELPYIRVVIERVAKAQPLNGFVAGYAVTQSTQIKKVQILVDEEEFSTYQLTYREPAYPNDKLMLLAVQQCAKDELGVTQCTPAVNFDWQSVATTNRPEIGSASGSDSAA